MYSTLQEKWIQGGVEPWVAGLGWARFREVWTASAHERPDGLIVMDDVIFQDTALAIMELGIKVPRQLSCVIHSNRGSGHFYPFPVTRMESDPVEFADAMLEQLETLMAGRKPADAVAQRVLGFRMIDANTMESSQSLESSR